MLNRTSVVLHAISQTVRVESFKRQIRLDLFVDLFVDQWIVRWLLYRVHALQGRIQSFLQKDPQENSVLYPRYPGISQLHSMLVIPEFPRQIRLFKMYMRIRGDSNYSKHTRFARM